MIDLLGVEKACTEFQKVIQALRVNKARIEFQKEGDSSLEKVIAPAEVTNGSCFQLPCSFQLIHPWVKDECTLNLVAFLTFVHTK
ncbi:hypothetical protein [Evansella clarkii]|uniref:hypothetical protein n=1 Tax=Evansella clarkii TaxID=79879 RepID=UPI000B44951F|nr:hypothetical protein [Evansella clarkii]